MHLSMQNKTRIAFVLVGIMILMAIYMSEGRPDGLRFSVKGETAYVNGGTDQFSLDEMKAFLKDNPDVERLVLRNMPGTTDSVTNLKIARLIRRRGLDTHLERRSYIASGAVDLFLSGVNRTMECGAMIGVHSWSLDGYISPLDLGSDQYQPMHERFLSDMGVDPKFYVFTRSAAEPENMYYLNDEEIERFGLLTQDAGCSK